MVPLRQKKATKPGKSMSEAAQKKQAAGGASKQTGPGGKAARRMSKDKVREIFLGRLSTGGVAIEIGVWHGDFSAMILDLIKPDKLYLIDPWANVTDESHSEAFVGRTEDDKMDRIFAKVQNRYAAEIRQGPGRDHSRLVRSRAGPVRAREHRLCLC